jgi:glycosyltransferase involved in cell wall biosynthesis
LNLSSIVIAKDEERNIGKCIESQIDCIDDIVVIVDEDSSDNTLEIVQSFKDVNYKVINWKGYSKTKEYALKKTKHDWVLWIDADEVLTSELQNELNELKNKNIDCSAYKMARKAFFLGKWIKHSGWYPSRVTRLFNKQHSSFNNSDVHENLIVKGNIGVLNSDLEHYTDPNIHHYYEKFNRYTTLAAKELNSCGNSVGFFGLIFRPLFLFIKMFLFKRGFLDGFYGFILAVFSANYVFTKYCKLWEIQKTNKKII